MNFVVKHCTTAVHILTNKCMYKQIGILYYTCCKYTLWCKKTAPFLVLWRFQFSKTRFGFVFLNPKTAVGFGLPGVKVNGAYLICDILLLKQLLPDIVKLLATFAFQRTTHAQVHWVAATQDSGLHTRPQFCRLQIIQECVYQKQ